MIPEHFEQHPKELPGDERRSEREERPEDDIQDPHTRTPSYADPPFPVSGHLRAPTAAASRYESEGTNAVLRLAPIRIVAARSRSSNGDDSTDKQRKLATATYTVDGTVAGDVTAELGADC